MNYLASDTFQILEDLEESGLDKKQAKAIFQVIRQSHEAKDVATKADIADVKRDIADVKKEIADVRKDLSAEIADVRKDLSAEIADIRKDIDTRFEKVDAQFADVRKDMESQFADIRKDMNNKLEKLGLSLTIKMGGMIGFLVVSIGLMLKYLR
ncbi:DUF1640 domain-containing protein [Candidatus Williamhamiltonella defendens]|uniref:DUF1640 domain-containing protein n=2 Tax=Candidatus Williamhamiltonella defendens TaxID=138072 RepID=A0A2D3TBN7_9ENTR|nr:DUF1640 domain-containing protein [Candidatus Hamiltonella defensa]ATW33114.1 DUF1640 domain-containing protein [Candidatus Hamiltonella defensa]